MKFKFLPYLCFIWLCACSALPPMPNTTASATSVHGDADELLAYHATLRQLAQPELAKALSDLNVQPKSARLALQKALVLGLMRGSGDLIHAQALLDGVLKSTGPEAERLKPLAQLLNANYAEWRRLDDTVDKLNQQIKDGQRRVDQLGEKLEALKKIERTLPARPSGNSN